MPLKKWKSMDIFNFSVRDNPIMESVQSKFAQISQSHAGTLLRNRRLGSLSSIKSDDSGSSQRQDDSTDATSPPMVQRTAIVQKDEKGYGLTVSGDNPVYVASVKPGGAAEKAGVQVGDKIIKVNGKLVTNSNHPEVVKMIRSTSLVQLTLLGKPLVSQPSNRDPQFEREPLRESITEKITGPQPVDLKHAEKEKDFRQQKLNTIRVMYDTTLDDIEKLKKTYKNNPSDKLQLQISDKEKTLKILEAQLPGNLASQAPSINVDDSVNTDNSSVSSWTTSVPNTVSDMGSLTDSTHTSPSTSPTPFQTTENDPVTGDSGIEDGSISSIVMSKPKIIGMDDDDFSSEDEAAGESKVFHDLRILETKPAHMAIFLHYVLNHHNPAPVLFYQMAGIYSVTPGNTKDLKKWAYEIHSTFLGADAPMRIDSMKEYITGEIESVLQFRTEKEESLRGIFNNARTAALDEVNKLLEDLRQKKDKGLIEGSSELRDQMDKSEELRIVERYLLSDLEKSVQLAEEEEKTNSGQADKYNTQAWAIATFLRHNGLHRPTTHSSTLERVQSFVTKDKKTAKFLKKSKSQKGHQFNLAHLTKQERCMHCSKVLWGVGFQGFQCQTCELCVHKHCVEDLEEQCSKKKKRVSQFVFRPKQTPATPIIGDNETMNSPTSGGTAPKVMPFKEPEDAERNAFKNSGHSVNNLVNRFESTSPDKETTGRKNSDLGRSESMKGRGDQRDRPARRSKSDVEVDESTLRVITSGSSSTSSIRSTESPSNSMDTLTAQIQEDSDFDVEPDLPSLKQVLGEETVRKLKPKEKKRQDVINELFYTEKCHVRNLKILDKLFYKPMMKEPSIAQDFTKSLFPNIETMIQLHSSLNNAMKARRKEKNVISTCGDLLLQRFDGDAGENFRNGCAIFCRNQSHTLEALKARVRKEPKMAQLLSDAENNPLCQRLALKDIIPKQFMRLTKYPLLIENLLKYTQTNTEEYTQLLHAHQCSKHILEYVNQAVKDCENHQRLIDLQRKIDKKVIDSNETDDIKSFDLTKHKLVHDGALTWRINNRKQIELHVVLLESAIVLLQKQDDRLVLKLQSTQLVAGQQDTRRHSPLLWLNNVLARDDATDKKAFFVVNTSKAGPQMYQFVANSSDDQKRWTKFITQASDAIKKNEINQKKKSHPPPQDIQEPPTTAEKQGPDQNHVELEPVEGEGTLVNPEDVQQYDPVISTAQVISPLEKLRQNDEMMAAVLEQRQNLLGELLNLSPPQQSGLHQDTNQGEDPRTLIRACEEQTSQLVELIHAAPAPVSGEQVDSVDDLTLPIPMERLRDMANRMNQILTNLLAQTRAVSTPLSSPMSQAAVNSRDEERDRLRRELKLAQDELNRLRRIQQMQMEANTDKKEEKSDRPASLISDSSVVSESEPDDAKEDSEQTDDQESVSTVDEQPGVPVEADIVSEVSSETLHEVSPVIPETMPDLETAMSQVEEEHKEKQYQEAEVEPVEEMLHEVEPPVEDSMEDIETPEIVKVVLPSDDDKDDDDSDEDAGDIDDSVTKMDEKEDAEKQTGESLSDNAEGEIGEPDLESLDVLERLQPGDTAGDSDNDTHSDTRDEKRDSDIYHDALGENQEETGEQTDLCNDPGGELEKVTNQGGETGENEAVSSTDKQQESSEDTVNIDELVTDVDNSVNDDPDTSAETQSNNNVDVDKSSSQNQSIKEDVSETKDIMDNTEKQECVETDKTVTSLNDMSAEQI